MAEKSKNKKSNGEQSDLCDLEQVTLKRVRHCLTTWLQIWYHSLLWGDSIRERASTEKSKTAYLAFISRNEENKLPSSIRLRLHKNQNGADFKGSSAGTTC